MSTTPIKKVLVANRGEIALRVMRTCRRMGIETVAVYSEVDAKQRHVEDADEAVCIGPAEARASYLNVAAVVQAAVDTGADAVHPGYGFLSENAEFARACAEAGLLFIGPPAEVLDDAADKLIVKRHVAAAGVPVIPGPLDIVSEDEAELTAAAEQTGYPLLLKASAGGGGKGMRRVESAEGLQSAAESARREAGGAFGKTDLYLERIIAPARHVEVQVVCDAEGVARTYGCRDCSMQRRHQKVLEESPVPGLATGAIEEAARQAATALGYRNAGTVEMLVEPDGTYWFLELNCRLQVEHPVTELVYGLDLVALQLAVAGGHVFEGEHALPAPQGHAIEARIYAEDPATGFLPSPGTLLHVVAPEGPGIRIDAAWHSGMDVSPHYDPMLAKIIAHGETRDEALARLDQALRETVVLGVMTNIGFLRRLLVDEVFQPDGLRTDAIDARLEALTERPPTEPMALFAAAVDEVLPGGLRRSQAASAGPAHIPSPWDTLAGFRLGEASA